MENVKIVSAAYIVTHHFFLKKLKVRKRRYWVTPIFRSREVYGGNDLVQDLVGGQFQNFCRLSLEDFGNVLALTESEIREKDTNYRAVISPRERLAITLHFLATGDSFTSLTYTFKVFKQSVSLIVFVN